MAVLTAAQIKLLYSDGSADKVALVAVRNVTTGDTCDMASEFLRIKQAVAMGATVNGVAVASASGTVVTIPTGLTNDAAYLLLWGCAG